MPELSYNGPTQAAYKELHAQGLATSLAFLMAATPCVSCPRYCTPTEYAAGASFTLVGQFKAHMGTEQS